MLADQDRAERLLALTGLTPDILRERLTDRTVLAAVVVLGDALTGTVSPLLMVVSLCTAAVGIAGLADRAHLR